MYFDAAVVFVNKTSLIFRLALAILCKVFSRSEKATDVRNYLPLDLTCTLNQIRWKIVLNFVAILEKLNFNTNLKNKATEAIIATRFDHCILFTDRQDPKMRKKNVKNI